ncbi:MAG: response regulator [Nannocystaceae bacterium]
MAGHPSLRVLLVDDEPGIRQIAADCLRVLGHMTVVEAGSCAEALARAASFVPEVILLDLMMPDQDGIEAMKRLRLLPSLANVPFVFLTARCRRRDVEALLALGAAGVISKPFDPLTLATQVVALVAGPDAEPALR